MNRKNVIKPILGGKNTTVGEQLIDSTKHDFKSDKQECAYPFKCACWFGYQILIRVNEKQCDWWLTRKKKKQWNSE